MHAGNLVYRNANLLARAASSDWPLWEGLNLMRENFIENLIILTLRILIKQGSDKGEFCGKSILV